MGSVLVLVPDDAMVPGSVLVLVVVHDQVVDTVVLEVSLVASDLFHDNMFLASVVVLWQSFLFHGHSPNLAS